jgi:hypothetical protein
MYGSIKDKIPTQKDIAVVRRSFGKEAPTKAMFLLK